MKYYSLIYFLFILTPHLFYSQKVLEENPNWIKYSKVAIINSHSNQTTVYHLKNGKPFLEEIFEDDSLISTTKIDSSIEILEKDTINNTYSSTGNLMRDSEINYFYNDKNQLTAKLGILSLYSLTNYYNKKGLISKQYERQFNGSLGYITGSMNSFSYDKCKNIIENKTKSIRLKDENIILQDYDFKDAVVLNYQYVYNRDCLWIKKYFIDKEGRKTLLNSRLIE